MKKVIVIMLMWLSTTLILKAQTTSDTLTYNTYEYKQIEIVAQPIRKFNLNAKSLWKVEEDNNDGSIIGGVNEFTKDKEYSSRMKALDVYVSVGWEVVDLEITTREGASYVYLLKRNKK